MPAFVCMIQVKLIARNGNEIARVPESSDEKVSVCVVAVAYVSRVNTTLSVIRFLEKSDTPSKRPAYY